MTGDEDLSARIGRALGSTRVVPLGGAQSGGPLDLLRLRRQVADLRSETPTVECHLKIAEQVWLELESLAAELRSEGQDVSATILARVVLERGVDALRDSRKRTG